MKLPLFAMNPKAKDQYPAFLDHLLAIDADGPAARAIAETHLEEARRFQGHRCRRRRRRGRLDQSLCQRGFLASFWLVRLYEAGWLIGILWASEPPCERRVREETLTAAYRVAYIGRHGVARLCATHGPGELGHGSSKLHRSNSRCGRPGIYARGHRVSLRPTCAFGHRMPVRRCGRARWASRRGLSPFAGLAALADARAAIVLDSKTDFRGMFLKSRSRKRRRLRPRHSHKTPVIVA